jgi:capsular exopolysaccharide synthesis family protein
MKMLLDQKKQLHAQLKRMKSTVKRFDSDPAVRDCADRLQEVMDEIEAVGQAQPFKAQMSGDPGQMITERMMQEIRDDQDQQQEMLARIQEAMPDHQKYLGLLEDRQQARQKIAEMERSIESFKTLVKTQKDPVQVLSNVVEPTVPVKPNRLVSIALGLIVSFGLGFALVFALEHFDHSVRVPEHVSHGLATPLLGVVPRITRTSRTHRGGHLWTPGAPDSLAADAFRNVRASLLGVADRHGPIVSLLVTSAKAGDGKSTAALNLAATCARAGERTLLLDVDLRRPSLDDVFPADPDDEERPGLVDVLRGVAPWQQALRRTDLHNLDFIATGDPRDVPIEILGTLELRQLLSALSHHYDRVILDGPAVLGMADCRVLGRMVDASVLVVRAGMHPIVTLQRAKAVLEQSQVEIAGVIVNSLSEGVRNWSSYGYPPAAVPAAARPSRALPAASAATRTDDEALLVAASAAG